MRSRSLIFSLVLACPGWGLMAEVAHAEPKPQPAPVKAEALDPEAFLKRLGDESFEEREKATEALVRMGEKARAAVEKTAKASEDPEVQQRCKQILTAIAEGKSEWGKAHPEEGLDLGGKPITFWVNELAKKDKDKLLEAIEYCRMAERRACRGIPILEKLSKHEDKEIATSAAEALKAVK